MEKKHVILVVMIFVVISGIYLIQDMRPLSHSGTSYRDVPVSGMVTLVDLGAASCTPCKMMAPILERLEKRYQGKAAIVFIDLRHQYAAGQHYGVQAIPTQIFFDRDGKEVSRHLGFMSEAAIVAQLAAMGVK